MDKSLTVKDVSAYAELSDSLLIASYRKALELNLQSKFVALLITEIKKRNINC